MTDVLELIIEIHDNGHSSLNHNWGWDKVLKLEANGNWQTNSYKVISIIVAFITFYDVFTYKSFIQAILSKNVHTKKYNCRPDSSFKITNCFDEFYMNKLNCSFPWLKSYNGPLQKCGSDNYVKDLVKHFGRVYNSDDEITKQLNEFGCTVPNCESITWLETNKIAEQLYEDKSYTKINLNFPSDSKVINK